MPRLSRIFIIPLLCIFISSFPVQGTYNPFNSMQVKTPSGPASAAIYKKRRAVKQLLEGLRNRNGFPGAVAGVCLEDGASFAVAVGYADRDRKTPMRPGDLLHAGSAGKTFFAALALQLVAQGRLSLDDKILRYLSSENWFAQLPNAKDITVRMLLNHTSGIPEYGESFMRDLVQEPSKPRSPLDAVKSVLGAKPVNAAGAAFSYTDVNYQLLGFVIERVTGRRAYRDIQQRILAPLGLKRIIPADRPRIAGLVPGYAGAKNPFGGDRMLVGGALVLDPRFEWGGGGFVTNAEDLACWLAAFSTGRAFDSRLLPEVLATVEATGLGQGARSGLGIEVEDSPLGKAYGHGGYFPGYFTQAYWYPAKRIAVAVQINTSDESLVKQSLKEMVNELTGAVLTDQVR